MYREGGGQRDPGETPHQKVHTDMDTAQAAADALEWNTQLLHERIKVTVRDGRVTPERHVDDRFSEGTGRYLTCLKLNVK